MGMETQPQLSNPTKELDFIDRVSLGYVGRVDSGFFGLDFRFFRFGRDFFIAKHKAIIMKKKSNMYLEGYNCKSDHVLGSTG